MGPSVGPSVAETVVVGKVQEVGAVAGKGQGVVEGILDQMREAAESILDRVREAAEGILGQVQVADSMLVLGSGLHRAEEQGHKG